MVYLVKVYDYDEWGAKRSWRDFFLPPKPPPNRRGTQPSCPLDLSQSTKTLLFSINILWPF